MLYHVKEEYGVEYRENYAYELLREARLSLQTARPQQYEADPEEKVEFQEPVKKRPELSEKIGVQVGIVEAIAGISNCEVTIEGNADHAGATGMFERSDALAAMAEVVAGVEAAGREHALNTDGTAVATVGELSVEPDVRNIVPGEATARLDLRDVTDEGIHALVERVRQVVERVDSERPVDATMEHYRHDGASMLSERCIGAAERAAVEAAVSTMRLHSAGVHDTALVSDVTDAALLFAPSVDGISHNPREWTDWEDCAAATQVLARTLVELAG